ncbi:MAG TPA: flagellar protein FlgN [Gaiellaceae bacterium]
MSSPYLPAHHVPTPAVASSPAAPVSAVLEHLDQQVASSQRLLQVVLAQGEAIRRQDVEGVLARLAEIQVEMGNRTRLERERDELLRVAAARLGTAPDAIDLETLLVGAPPADGERARALSAQLRGLLGEIGRVHDQNRVLIRQELTFLDHLMRVMSGSPQAGYSPRGWSSAPQSTNVLDARA